MGLRYPIVISGDSSSDLILSVDGVDQKLSPDSTSFQSACSSMTTTSLGTNVFYTNKITIPAATLDIPSCGEPCLTAASIPPNASSVDNCPAGTPSGRVCSVNCNPGFELVGGSTRCDDGDYVTRSQCSDRPTCSFEDALQSVGNIADVTGSGCGETTIGGHSCFFNCNRGFFSTGKITCDPTTNQWVPSENAACHPGTGTGGGTPEPGPGPCEVDPSAENQTEAEVR